MKSNIDITDKILKKNFIYSLTIKERIEAFKNKNIDLQTDMIFLERWTNIKGLSNIQDTINRLSYENINVNEFAYALKPFDDYEIEILEEYLEKQEWYRFFLNIIKEYSNTVSYRVDNYENLAIILNPIINHFYKFIKMKSEKMRNIVVSEKVVNKILDFVTSNLLSYILKVVTIELQRYKEKRDGKKNIFSSFLRDKYGNLDSIIEFYNRYPTMTRLIITRLMYYKKHFFNVLDRIDNNFKEISMKFNIDNNKLEDIYCGEGDSHQGGQSVITLAFEGEQKVIYKPKNLLVEDKFNKLLDWINKSKSSKDNYIKKVKSMYMKDYTISEYIKYEEAKTEEDIKKYYRNIGKELMILYCLIGNDFHYENIIANGSNPYLVDIETLFQNNIDIVQFYNTSEELVRRRLMNSVLSIGILPFIGLQKSIKGDGVDISALNGQKQVLPYKILKMKNFNTTDMIFEYDYVEIDDSKNIPIYNGEKKLFYKYIDNIIEGFDDVGKEIIENKEEFKELVISLFNDDKLIVRQLLKSTNSYASLLQFVNHPNYLCDMVYLERLLDNLSSYSYVDKRIVNYEIEDMMRGDIPIFFSKVNSKSIISSNGTVLENYYNKTPLERCIERISELDDIELNKEKSYILITLHEYEKENESSINKINESNIDKKISKSSYSCIIDDINNTIFKKLEYNSECNEFTGEVVNNISSSIEPINYTIEYGLNGIGLYLYYLSMCKDISLYKNLCNSIYDKNIKFYNREFNKSLEFIQIAYYLICTCDRDINKIEKIADKIIMVFDEFKLKTKKNENIIHENKKNLISIAKVLSEVYKLIHNTAYINKSYEVLELLGVDISSVKLETVVVLRKIVSLDKCNDSYKLLSEYYNKYLDQVININPEELWRLRKYDKYDNGIIFDINLLIDAYLEKNEKSYLEHAKRIMNVLIESYDNWHRFRVYEGFKYCSLGINDGITGIAYTILRLSYPHKVNNIFTLDIL